MGVITVWLVSGALAGFGDPAPSVVYERPSILVLGDSQARDLRAHGRIHRAPGYAVSHHAGRTTGWLIRWLTGRNLHGSRVMFCRFEKSRFLSRWGKRLAGRATERPLRSVKWSWSILGGWQALLPPTCPMRGSTRVYFPSRSVSEDSCSAARAMVPRAKASL